MNKFLYLATIVFTNGMIGKAPEKLQYGLDDDVVKSGFGQAKSGNLEPIIAGVHHNEPNIQTLDTLQQQTWKQTVSEAVKTNTAHSAEADDKNNSQAMVNDLPDLKGAARPVKMSDKQQKQMLDMLSKMQISKEGLLALKDKISQIEERFNFYGINDSVTSNAEVSEQMALAEKRKIKAEKFGTPVNVKRIKQVKEQLNKIGVTSELLGSNGQKNAQAFHLLARTLATSNPKQINIFFDAVCTLLESKTKHESKAIKDLNDQYIDLILKFVNEVDKTNRYKTQIGVLEQKLSDIERNYAVSNQGTDTRIVALNNALVQSNADLAAVRQQLTDAQADQQRSMGEIVALRQQLAAAAALVPAAVAAAPAPIGVAQPQIIQPDAALQAEIVALRGQLADAEQDRNANALQITALTQQLAAAQARSVSDIAALRQQLAAATTAQNRSAADIAALTQRLAAAEADRDARQNDVVAIKLARDAALAAQTASQSQIATLTQELEASTAANTAHQTQQTTLGDRIRQLEETLAQQSAAHTAHQTEQANLRLQMQELEGRLTAQTAANTQNQAEQDALRARIDALNTQLQESIAAQSTSEELQIVTQTALEQAQRDLAEKTQENTGLRADLAHFHDLATRYQTAQANVTFITNSNTELESTIAGLSANLQTLEQANQTLRVDNERLNILNQTLTDSNASLTQQLEASTQRALASETALTTLGAQNTQNQARFEREMAVLRADLDDHRQSNIALRAQLDAAQARADQAEASSNAKDAQIADLNIQLEALRANLATQTQQSQTSLAAAQATNAQLSAELAVAIANITTAELTSQASATRITQLEKQVVDQTTVIQDSQQSIATLTASLAAQTAASQVNQERIDALTGEKDALQATLQAEITRLEQQNTASQEQITASTQRIATLEAQINSKNREIESTRAASNAQQIAHAASIEALNTELQNKHAAAIAKLSAELTNEHLDALTAQTKTMSDQLHAQQIALLTSLEEKEREMIELSSVDNETYRQEMKQTFAAMIAQKASLEAQQASLQVLQTTLGNTQQELNTLQADLIKAREDIAQETRALEQKRTELQEAQAKLQQTKTEHDKLITEMHELEAEIHNIQTLKHSHEGLKNNFDALNGEHVRLKSAYEKLNAKVETVQAEIKTSKTIIEEKEAALSAKDIELTDMHNKLDVLQRQYTMDISQMENVEANLAHIRVQCASLEKANQALIEEQKGREILQNKQIEHAKTIAREKGALKFQVYELNEQIASLKKELAQAEEAADKADAATSTARLASTANAAASPMASQTEATQDMGTEMSPARITSDREASPAPHNPAESATGAPALQTHAPSQSVARQKVAELKQKLAKVEAERDEANRKLSILIMEKAIRECAEAYADYPVTFENDNIDRSTTQSQSPTNGAGSPTLPLAQFDDDEGRNLIEDYKIAEKDHKLIVREAMLKLQVNTSYSNQQLYNAFKQVNATNIAPDVKLEAEKLVKSWHSELSDLLQSLDYMWFQLMKKYLEVNHTDFLGLMKSIPIAVIDEYIDNMSNLRESVREDYNEEVQCGIDNKVNLDWVDTDALEDKLPSEAFVEDFIKELQAVKAYVESSQSNASAAAAASASPASLNTCEQWDDEKWFNFMFKKLTVMTIYEWKECTVVNALFLNEMLTLCKGCQTIRTIDNSTKTLFDFLNADDNKLYATFKQYGLAGFYAYLLNSKRVLFAGDVLQLELGGFIENSQGEFLPNNGYQVVKNSSPIAINGRVINLYAIEKNNDYPQDFITYEQVFDTQGSNFTSLAPSPERAMTHVSSPREIINNDQTRLIDATVTLQLLKDDIQVEFDAAKKAFDLTQSADAKKDSAFQTLHSIISKNQTLIWLLSPDQQAMYRAVAASQIGNVPSSGAMAARAASGQVPMRSPEKMAASASSPSPDPILRNSRSGKNNRAKQGASASVTGDDDVLTPNATNPLDASGRSEVIHGSNASNLGTGASRQSIRANEQTPLITKTDTNASASASASVQQETHAAAASAATAAKTKKGPSSTSAQSPVSAGAASAQSSETSKGRKRNQKRASEPADSGTVPSVLQTSTTSVNARNPKAGASGPASANTTKEKPPAVPTVPASVLGKKVPVPTGASANNASGTTGKPVAQSSASAAASAQPLVEPIASAADKKPQEQATKKSGLFTFFSSKK